MVLHHIKVDVSMPCLIGKVDNSHVVTPMLPLNTYPVIVVGFTACLMIMNPESAVCTLGIPAEVY